MESAGKCLLSVVITTFDSQSRLDATISSLARAGCAREGWEIIVVDDGSTPPARIGDESVRLIRLEANEGPASARRAGAMQARGEYVLHIDAGDEVSPSLTPVLSAAMSSGADAIVFGYRTIYPGGRTTETIPRLPGDGSAAAAVVLRGDAQGYLWNKAFRRDLYTRSGAYCPSDIRIWEDKVICVELLASAKTVLCLSDVLLTYFAGLAGSLSATASVEGRFAALNVLESYLTSVDKPAGLVRALDTARLLLKLDCMWAVSGSERRRYAGMFREIDVAALDGTSVRAPWKLALSATRFGSTTLFNALCLYSKLFGKRRTR